MATGMANITRELDRGSVAFDAMADWAAKQPERLSGVIAGLSADSAKVRYGCMKVLRLISERSPAAVYPEIGRFVDLLQSDKTILKWGAIRVVGNLAVVDHDGKIDRILGRYLRPISGPVMITAANTVRGAGMIAAAKPYLADRIARALLGVERARYQTMECRNVVTGHVIESLDLFFDHIRRRQAVVAFVARQLVNRRHAVRRKAAALLAKRGLTPHATSTLPG